METGRNYKKTNETTYALGASLTFELLTQQPQQTVKVYFHPDFSKSKEHDRFIGLCQKNHIYYEENAKIFRRLADKEKCLVIGEFKKYKRDINPDKNHLVLVNPSNMGNLGTIIRTAIGFGINDIALVRPAADIYDPKVIRASMGSFYQLRFTYFNTFEEYEQSVSKRPYYTFRLNASTSLAETKIPEHYSLIFGNESSGLPDEFDFIGNGVIIQHYPTIDSLSLPVAVSIGLYEFTKRNHQ